MVTSSRRKVFTSEPLVPWLSKQASGSPKDGKNKNICTLTDFENQLCGTALSLHVSH